MANKMRLVFLAPFIVIIWPPLYAHRTPELGPIPFMIWFQFALIGIGCALTAIVYWVELVRSNRPIKAKGDNARSRGNEVH